jgi:AmiR/NasT family two-component response regulator
MSGLSEASNTARILIAEDDVTSSEDLTRSLKNLGYDVVGRFSSREDAVRAAEELRPDLILMAIKVEGGIDRIDAAEPISSRLDIPVVYFTDLSEEDVLEFVRRMDIYGYLGKPLTLLELGITIETALYKHRMERRLKENEARRAKAEELAGLHSWEWDIETGRLVWSAESYRAFGLDPVDTELTFDRFINSVHPKDKERVRSTIRDALDDVRPYDVEFRIVLSNGHERLLHSRGEIQRDAK